MDATQCNILRLLAALCLSSHVLASTIVQPPGTYAPISTYRYFFGKRLPAGQNITAKLAVVTTGQACGSDFINRSLVQGRIVFVPWRQCSASKKASVLSQYGAIAMVLDSSFVSATTKGFDCYWDHDIDPPSVDLYPFNAADSSAGDLRAILEKLTLAGTPIDISMSLTTDENPWSAIIDSWRWIMFQVIFTLFALFNMCISGKRLYHLVREKGCALTIPVFCLGMECSISFIRVVVTATDPVASRLVFGRMASFILFSITSPLNMITTIILAFFFHELTSSSKLSKVSFLAKPSSKIIAGVVAFILVFMDVYTSILRANFTADNAFLIHNVITTIIMIGLVILFLNKTWNVRRFLLRGGHANEKTKKSVGQLTQNVFLTAMFMLAEACVRTSAVAVKSSMGFYIVIFLGFLTANARSYFQILAFSTKEEKKDLDLSNTVGGRSSLEEQQEKRRSRMEAEKAKRQSMADRRLRAEAKRMELKIGGTGTKVVPLEEQESSTITHTPHSTSNDHGDSLSNSQPDLAEIMPSVPSTGSGDGHGSQPETRIQMQPLRNAQDNGAVVIEPRTTGRQLGLKRSSSGTLEAVPTAP